MRRLFAVLRVHGPRWDESRPLELQTGWREHADFMNALAAARHIVIGGTLEGTDETLLIFSAHSEHEIRERLASDPWGDGMLKTVRIASWQVRLGEERLAAWLADWAG